MDKDVFIGELDYRCMGNFDCEEQLVCWHLIEGKNCGFFFDEDFQQAWCSFCDFQMTYFSEFDCESHITEKMLEEFWGQFRNVCSCEYNRIKQRNEVAQLQFEVKWLNPRTRTSPSLVK